MAGKRVSAFSKAMQQAAQEGEKPIPTPPAQKPQPKIEPSKEDSVWDEISMPEDLGDLLPPSSPPPSVSPAIERAKEAHSQLIRNKGGRPRGAIKKSKFTYYLPDSADGDITAIKKGLVKHADILLEDKGAVVEQALSFMRFGLESAGDRELFLELYQRWLSAVEEKGS